MNILYLDQNKWIDLARANSAPQSNYSHSLVLAKILELVAQGQLLVPLSASNIYETQKINDLSRREAVASVQSILSRGNVFICGSSRLRTELQAFLSNIRVGSSTPLTDRWFLSSFFLDAFAERSVLQKEARLSDSLLRSIQSNPVEALYSYMIDLPDEPRKQAVRSYSTRNADLRGEVEQRRKRLDGQSHSMHRRVYQATLMIDNIDLILKIAQDGGFSWRSASEIGPEIMKRMANELPYFSVETELAVKLERSNRVINENDFRDMLSICAVVPYSNYVVMEKAFANLAIQAKLDKKFETQILTNISDLNLKL